jgi:hypothetical protein
LKKTPVHLGSTTASNAEAYGWFGNSVSLAGDTLAVGATGEDSNQTTITNGEGASNDNSAWRSGAVYVYRNLDKLSDPNLRVSEQSSNSITLSWHSNMGLADRVKIVPATMEKKHPLAAMMSTPSRLMPTSLPIPTPAFPQHQIRLSGVCL